MTPPSNLPRPPLFRPRFGIKVRPNQEIDVELRFARGATRNENPSSPEVRTKIRKNYKIPDSGLGPQNTEKVPKMGIF